MLYTKTADFKKKGAHGKNTAARQFTRNPAFMLNLLLLS